MRFMRVLAPNARAATGNKPRHRYKTQVPPTLREQCKYRAKYGLLEVARGGRRVTSIGQPPAVLAWCRLQAYIYISNPPRYKAVY